MSGPFRPPGSSGNQPPAPPSSSPADEASIDQFESLEDYASGLEKSGLLPAAPVEGGEFLQEQAIETIDEFESLEDYAKDNPAASEPSESGESALELSVAPPPPPEPAHQESDSSLFPVDAPSDAQEGMALDGLSQIDLSGPPPPPFTSSDSSGLGTDGPGAPVHNELSGLSEIQTGNLSGHELGSDEGLSIAPPTQDYPQAPEMLGGFESTQAPEFQSQEGEPPPALSIEAPSHSPGLSPSLSMEPPAPIKQAPRMQAPPPPPGMDRVRQYSEQTRTPVSAQFPFSLMIEGTLEPEERERLIDLLGREGFGISEVDLEPQLKAGKILIPRVSEYAGVLLVQALRTAKARIRLGPSDTVFSTGDTRDAESDRIDSSTQNAQVRVAFQESGEGLPAAERIPVSTESTLPGFGPYYVLDAVTASVTLRTMALEAESSYEYQEALEQLKLELQYKASRKGANGIVNFGVQLITLPQRSQYRLMAVGSAIRSGQPRYPEPGPLPVKQTRDTGMPPYPAKAAAPAAPAPRETRPQSFAEAFPIQPPSQSLDEQAAAIADSPPIEFAPMPEPLSPEIESTLHAAMHDEPDALSELSPPNTFETLPPFTPDLADVTYTREPEFDLDDFNFKEDDGDDGNDDGSRGSGPKR